MNHRTALLALAFTTAAASPAFAQEEATKAPTFATTDRQDGSSRYGGDLGFTIFDDDGVGASLDWGMRIDLYGQYVVPTGTARAGGYVSVAISRLEADVATDSELSNLELGGIYAITSSDMEVVLHGGITLPTAGDGLDSLITNTFAGRGRLTDIAQAVPETTWLRVGASPILRSGNTFIRFDAGVDLPIDEDDVFEVDPFGRINAAAGFVAGANTFMVELATITDLGDDNDNDEDFFHTLAVGARLRTNTEVQPLVAAVLPLDDSVRDAIPLVIMAGIQYTPFE